MDVMLKFGKELQDLFGPSEFIHQLDHVCSSSLTYIAKMTDPKSLKYNGDVGCPLLRAYICRSHAAGGRWVSVSWLSNCANSSIGLWYVYVLLIGEQIVFQLSL